MGRKARHDQRNFLMLKPDARLADLGRPVAEEDPHLADFYVGRERYLDRALDKEDPAVFFMGPKGVGKSAVLQMVRSERQSDVRRLIEIAPDELAFSALANVEASTPLLREAEHNQWLFKSLWDYILSVEVLKRESRDLSSIFTLVFGGKPYKAARQLLQISLADDGSKRNLIERLLQLVKEVEVSGSSGDTTLSGKLTLGNSSTRPGEQLHLLSQVNQVAKSLPSLLKHDYYVLIDDLDLHWTDRPLQNSCIAALFSALRQLNRPPHLKFVVALRDDIYRRLPITDKDKTRGSICDMEWEESSVKQMLEVRVATVLSCARADVWSRVFPKRAFHSWWSVTNGLPRELIRMMALSIEEADRRGHTRVDDGDLRAAILKFSEERIQDLASEHRHDYPGLDDLVRKFAGWPKEFDVSRLGDFAAQLFIDVDDRNARYSWAGGFGENAAGLAKELLTCGALLFKPSRTAAPQRFNPSEDLPDDFWLAIHPMYAPALGLVGA